VLFDLKRPSTSLPRLFLLAAIIAFVLPLSCFGQAFMSSITGTVTDPTGAAVPGAQVELRNVNTNDVHEGSTQGDGTFQFNNLIPGTYQIAVVAPGFKTYIEQNLELKAQVATSINVPLAIGGTQERVEVTASAALVDTQTANTAATMETRLVQDLPNAARNPLNFVFALAGTTAPPIGQSGKFQVTDQMTSNCGLNGGRTGSASILIDGAPSQAIDWGGLLVSPLQDSVQEQQVVTNNYDAQFQRGGSGIVTLITRGGTAQYHGEGFDFLQKDVFNANGWANNKYEVPRGEFMQNLKKTAKPPKPSSPRRRRPKK